MPEDGGPGPVHLVGVHGGQCFGSAAATALRRADRVVGAARHLDALPGDITAARVELDPDLDSALRSAAACSDQGLSVCILASGDPGFFGLTRLAAARLGGRRLQVHPAPSSVALAAARLGLSWDDAVVVSAHGRPLDQAAEAVSRHAKVFVLGSPDSPPQALGQLLMEQGTDRQVAVVSHAGDPQESVWAGDVAALAGGTFDPVSVVVCWIGEATGPGWAWGRPDHEFEHRDGMITKAEVRAVALGKLALPLAGVMWDVGAGSGSVAVEAARLASGLRVFAVERRPDDLDRLRRNVAGTGTTVVAGEAPAVLDQLPDPDRVFIGGGGTEVLEAVRARLRPGGVVVATYASLERAAAGARLLGSVVQVAVSRGVPVGPDGSLRLAADNPVFVCWGPG